MNPSPAAIKKAEERARAKNEKLFLANDVLGYDFQECHAELFALYPSFDAGKSWDEQTPVKDILILWPRGHYKSTALKVVIIQAILNNPDITILLMQGSVKVTKIFLSEILKHFTGEAQDSRLKELFPEFCGSKKQLQATLMEFTVPCRERKQTPQATCTVASPKSIKTGQHYLLGVFDDLVNESNYRNPKLVEQVYEDFKSCQPLVQHGCRWVSGTRWAFGDLYEQIIRWNESPAIPGTTKRPWTISVKDCWTDDKVSVRFPRFTKKSGELDGFNRDMLLELQALDLAFFACQYLNKPVAESLQSITEAELNAAVITPPQAPSLSRAVFFVDLAAPGINPDDSVVVVGKIDNLGKQYVVEWAGGTFDPLQLGLNIILLALKYRPLKVLFEGTASSKYFVPMLQMMCRDKGIELPIDYIKVDNKADAKNIRVRSMCANVKQKRVFFFAGLPNWQKFVDQTTQFPKGKYGHDDYPDTVALMSQFFAVNYIGIAPVAVTKHPMIALLDRDPISSIDSMGKEYTSPDSTMGSDFV